MWLAEIDFGIKLHFLDLHDLQRQAHDLSKSHVALGIIDYGQSATASASDTSHDIGFIVYLKLSMTGNEPASLHDYRRRNQRFHTTRHLTSFLTRNNSSRTDRSATT